MKGNFELPKMLTINECSQVLGLAKYHIRQLVLQKKIKYVQTGKKYLVNFQSLLVYLNNGEIEEETTLQIDEVKKLGVSYETSST